jgi:serine-type D-Ala-D-Ala carboxypeptidase
MRTLSSLIIQFCLGAIFCYKPQDEIASKIYNCTGDFCEKLLPSIKSAIFSKAAPGIAAAVGTEKSTLFEGVAGGFTYNTDSARITRDTLFDMASCTKVLVATTAIAQLYQQGIIDLDWKVADPRLLGPSFASQPGKEKITVRNLLLHNAGFPPDPTPYLYWEPLFPCPNNKNYHPGQDFSCIDKIYEHLILNQTLSNPPGESYTYSDLSMITIMFIIAQRVKSEGIVNQTDFIAACNDTSIITCYYAGYVQKYILDRYKLNKSTFIPSDSTATPPEWEEYKIYRHMLVDGFVSDANAYAMGGISGHAGLFSTLSDIPNIVCVWLFDDDSKMINKTTRDLFTKVHNISQSAQALGWIVNIDKAITPGFGALCGTLSNTTFYFIGYTGTQVCLDPQRGLYTILLGNGRFPDFEVSGIANFRPLYNTMVQHLFDKRFEPFLED